jgi:hypothetical protein
MLSLLALLTVGCAYEKKLAVSSAAPPWVIQTPPDTEESLVFVGSGIADNILDQRTARDRAMEDVRAQIAASLETMVVSEAIDIVEERGAAHMGQDKEKATYSRQVEQKVAQAMSGVRQEGFYWEKWKIKRGLFSGAYSKYLYYVKASIPRDTYQKLATELTHQIAADIQTRAQ